MAGDFYVTQAPPELVCELLTRTKRRRVTAAATASPALVTTATDAADKEGAPTLPSSSSGSSSSMLASCLRKPGQAQSGRRPDLGPERKAAGLMRPRGVRRECAAREEVLPIPLVAQAERGLVVATPQNCDNDECPNLLEDAKSAIATVWLSNDALAKHTVFLCAFCKTKLYSGDSLSLNVPFLDAEDFGDGARCEPILGTAYWSGGRTRKQIVLDSGWPYTPKE